MNDMEINFSFFDVSNEEFKFKSIGSLISFLDNERDYWDEKLELLKGRRFDPEGVASPFVAVSEIEYFCEEVKKISNKVLDSEKEGDSLDVSKLVQEKYDNISSYLPSRWLYSNHPYTHNFVDVAINHGKVAAEAFLSYILKQQSQLPRSMTFDQFKGYISAYEFENQDSDLVKRREGERAAVEKIRREFVDGKDQLFSEVAALKTDYEDLSAEAKQELVEELEAWQQQRAENDEKVDQAITQYQKSVSDSIGAHNAEIEAIKEESRNKIRAIEETYEERLRLEPAAKHWKDSASRLRIQGGILGTLIMITVVIGLVAGGYLFHIWLSHEKLPIDLTSLQGVLITITVLAIYAYILRLLSRMTFSCFHLMRDAEEREQLTYLYLALSNQTDVDEKSREIVLQALFSRSETGLLTNEHGPVMPGMDLNQLLKGIGR